MRGPSSRRPVSDCWRQRSIVTARSGRHGSPLSTWGPVHRRWVGAPLRTPRQRHRRPRVRLLGGVHARRGGVSTLLRGTAGVHGFDTRRRARLRSRVHLPVLGADQPLFVRAHRPLYRRQRVALLGTDGHGRHRGRWPVSARGVAHARGGGAGRPRRRDLRSDGDDRERRGDARLPPRVGAVRAGTGPDRRRCGGQIRTGAAPLLAAERHGRPDARLRVPSLRDDGQGGRLLPRPRASPPDESRMGVGRRDPGAPDDDRRGAAGGGRDRHQGVTRLLDGEPPRADGRASASISSTAARPARSTCSTTRCSRRRCSSSRGSSPTRPGPAISTTSGALAGAPGDSRHHSGRRVEYGGYPAVQWVLPRNCCSRRRTKSPTRPAASPGCIPPWRPSRAC